MKLDWIDVNDSLPKMEDDGSGENLISSNVLVFTTNENIYMGFCIRYYLEDKVSWFQDDGDCTELEVTHWMKLPQKPKNKGK
jgi:hypothetical protein